MRALLAAVSLTLSATVVLADQPAPEVARIFPSDLGNFHQTAPIRILNREALRKSLGSINDAPNEVFQISVAETEYASPDGEKFRVSINKFENDSAAYSRFTFCERAARAQRHPASAR